MPRSPDYRGSHELIFRKELAWISSGQRSITFRLTGWKGSTRSLGCTRPQLLEWLSGRLVNLVPLDCPNSLLSIRFMGCPNLTVLTAESYGGKE